MVDELKTDVTSEVVAEPTEPTKSNAQIRYEAWCQVHDAGQAHTFGHPSWDKTPQLVKDAWEAADKALDVTGPADLKPESTDSNKSVESGKSESKVETKPESLDPPIVDMSKSEPPSLSPPQSVLNAPLGAATLK